MANALDTPRPPSLAPARSPQHRHQAGTWREVLAVFLRLGLTSFGGPVAHLGYFRDAFVVRRRWLDEQAYADLVALAQFLPGPASSQVGLAIGLARAGLPGALAAWTGFTLPSAVLLVLFAYGIAALGGSTGAGWLAGLKIAAVAVVAQAVWGMARSLCPDKERATLAVGATLVVLALPGSPGQIAAIALGGLCGWLFFSGSASVQAMAFSVPVPRALARTCLALFFVLLALLPLVDKLTASHTIALIDSFYRTGALVFGGGHVILPLLEAQVVAPGWVDREDFLAGYGAAQAIPGPLFTFSAYLGVMMGPEPNGLPAAVICLLAIFAPSALLVLSTLPFWNALRRREGMQAALMGVNAAVVGLLLAALYDPVWTSAVHGPVHFGLAVAAFAALALWSLPPWLVVILCALAGAVLPGI